MNGIMNENQLVNVKKYEIIRALFHKLDCVFDNCFRDCHNECFLKFEYRCIYNYEFTNIGINEVINLTIYYINMGLYGVNEKMKIAQ